MDSEAVAELVGKLVAGQTAGMRRSAQATLSFLPALRTNPLLGDRVTQVVYGLLPTLSTIVLIVSNEAEATAICSLPMGSEDQDKGWNRLGRGMHGYSIHFTPEGQTHPIHLCVCWRSKDHPPTTNMFVVESWV